MICALILQVVCVLLSIGGVALVSFYSNSKCSGQPPDNINATNTSHMTGHTLSSRGGNCGKEESAPIGYVVSCVIQCLD